MLEKYRGRPSAMPSQQRLAQVPGPQIQRSAFDRSHGCKTTFDAGELIPIFADEALPGDTVSMKVTAFARVATLIQPLMDNLYLDFFFFAIPNRLVWNNWQKFCGEQDNPGDPTDYLVPTMTSPAVTGYVEKSLSDYLGIPIGVPDLEHSALFHRSYALVWNEWFRDENLQDRVVVDKDDGPDDPADYTVQRRGKRKDYFAGALPWPQKGEAVSLPLGTTAPLQTTGTGIPTFWDGTASGAFGNSAGVAYWVGGVPTPDPSVASWKDPALEVDLSTATAATINELRQAFQIQRLYERDARGGTRYVELLLAHFGVVSDDARLQRPEYLGGGTVPVMLQPVPQTSATAGFSPLGRLSGYGVATGQVGFTRSFTEHCILLGLVASRADLNYQQGLPRQFSRSTRWDFYWPALAHLGEQVVFNKEIYAQGTVQDDEVFGYQERFAEYRYKPSQCTGMMRSTSSAPLDNWHLAQEFASLPTLGPDFVVENPPMDRVIALATGEHFLFDSFFELKHVRPMPTWSVPGLIDHF